MKSTFTLLLLSFFTFQLSFAQCDIPGGEMENFIDFTEEFEYDFEIETDSIIYVNQEFTPFLRFLFAILGDVLGDLVGTEIDEFVSEGLGHNRYSPGADGTDYALQLTPGKFLNIADAGSENFYCGARPQSLKGKYLHEGSPNDTAIILALLDEEPSYDVIFNSDTFDEFVNADVDGIGFMQLVGGPNTYTEFEIPINYNNETTPDSALIYILTFGDSLYVAQGNPMYYVIDQLQFTDFEVSTKDLDLSEAVDLFPNPANESITIKSASHQLSNIKIYDALGQAIYQSNNTKQYQHTIDISQLTSGIYYLETDLDQYFARKKFVKL